MELHFNTENSQILVMKSEEYIMNWKKAFGDKLIPEVLLEGTVCICKLQVCGLDILTILG